MNLPFDEVKVVEDTPDTTHVVLTDANVDMSDEQMAAVVGGLTAVQAFDRMQEHRPLARRLGSDLYSSSS